MGDSTKKKTILFYSIHCSVRTPSTVHTGVLDSDPEAAGSGHGVLDN